SILGWSAKADAYERQWQASLGLGYTHLSNGGGTALKVTSLPGFGASLGISYGLNDSLNLVAHGDFSMHPGDAPVLIGGGGVGIGYVIDVLRWVPWLGLTAGAYGVSVGGPCVSATGAECTTARLGLSLPFGLDYQLNRSFSIGAGGRYGLLLFGNQNKVDQTISVFARAQYIWGY
ncbi:MAG TPA: hypothetical protein PK156_45460, partial [Polyangium sp.]|nr:hypothetical protein [Polyangium sp.]